MLVTRLFDGVADRFISLDDFYLANSLENRVQWRLIEVDTGVFAFCEPFLMEDGSSNFANNFALLTIRVLLLINNLY